MKLRAGTIHKAVNPKTGRVIAVKGAKERAWKALSRLVRLLEPRCATCGGETSEAGHFRHNTDKTGKQIGGNMLWYDFRNIHGQCGVCNRHHSGRLFEYALFMERKYGSGIIQELNRLYQTPKKWTIAEILEIAEGYEKEYQTLV